MHASGRGWPAITGLFLALVAPASALVESESQLKICLGKYPAPREERVSACNAVIEAGAATPTVFALGHVFRGDTAREDGKLNLAVEEYEQAIELARDNPEAYCGRGAISYINGDFDAAIADFDQAVRLKTT